MRAVLFVDVVESVRLIERDESGVVDRWLRFVDDAQREIVPSSQGRLVKKLGDGLLIELPDVRSAVGAAFKLQAAAAHINEGVAPELQIRIRIAIAASEILIDYDDIYGRGVNLASRLLTLAGPGEIVISAQTRDELIPQLDADVEDLGECFLRNLDDPVRAYRIGPPSPANAHPRLASDLGQLMPSVAIIPFTAALEDADAPLLGDILAEECIRVLSQSREISVISRLSTAAFRGRHPTGPEARTLLKADYVLSGLYRVTNRRLVLDLELADTFSERILWTERFSGALGNLLAGGSDLAARVAAGVERAIIAREVQRSVSNPLPTLKSYTLLVGAIGLMHRLSRHDFDDARRLLQALIDRGIRHPAAYAWLANWHVLRVQQGWSHDERQDAYFALEATKRALDTDPRFSLALAIDGFVHTNLLKRLDVALDRYDLAIDSNGSESLAWLLRGTLHAFTGAGEKAVSDTEKALRLSPLDPQAYFYDTLAAGAHIASGNNRRALELARRSLRANRRHASTLRILAVAQHRLGLGVEARATVQELLLIDPSLTIKRWMQRSPSAAYDVGRAFAHDLREAGIPE